MTLMSQQLIYILSKLLTEDAESFQAKSKRQKAVALVENLDLYLPENSPTPEQLLRNDRENVCFMKQTDVE